MAETPFDKEIMFVNKTNIIDVSVVVPIYNALSDGRIERLICCLKKQTLQTIEFILIIDCPTDGTDIKVSEMVKNDERFVIIRHSQNKGIGLSRNDGIECARGKYIAFADHDDEIRESMYEDLFRIAASEEADITISPARIRWENGSETIEYWDETILDVRKYFLDRITGESFLQEQKFDPYPLHWGNGNMWNKIFRRKLILDNQINFVDTRIICYEDVLFQMLVFACAKKVSFTHQFYYTHIFYPTQTNTSFNSEYKNSNNLHRALANMINNYNRFPQQIEKDRVQMRINRILIPQINRMTYPQICALLNLYDKKQLVPFLSLSNLISFATSFKSRLYYILLWLKVQYICMIKK